jgi:hypothetical protein
MPFMISKLVTLSGRTDYPEATAPDVDLSFSPDEYYFVLEDSSDDAHVAITFNRTGVAADDQIVLRAGGKGANPLPVPAKGMKKLWARKIAGTTVVLRIMAFSV